MSEGGTAQTQTQTQPSLSSRGGSQSGRRGRPGRGRGEGGNGRGGRRGGGRNAAPQPQNQEQSASAPEVIPVSASEPPSTGSGRRGRGRGGGGGGSGRGGRRGGAVRGGAVSGTQRTFGGSLTTNANVDDSEGLGLSADAPDFIPGQPLVQRGKQASRHKKPQYPLAPKSTAADLPTRLHEDISNGQYDCEIPMQARCYCGKEHKEIPCDRRGDLQMSFNHGQVSSSDSEDIADDSWFDGSFDCGANCGRKYDCGLHECEKTCHPQDEISAHCPSSPDVVLDCPCGKTPLDELLDQPRQSCRDKIPHCKKTCDKVLSCGHRCLDTCHTGPCNPCFQKADISCRCGRTTSSSMCHQGDIAKPMCMRVCQAQLNCGRHKCGEHCCPGEKKAMERQAAKRKHRQQQAPDEVEAEHICLRVCGRTLKCGTHQCSQICHAGPCPSCLEAVFEEISSPPCGHPTVKHNCHPDDVACPKCPFLVEKDCICGKQRMKNRPCWLEEARCGLPCGKKLKCGTHTCRKECHRPGECEDAEIPGSHCAQSCGKTRKSCEHSCQDACHAPYPCKEDRPCQSKTFITCDCQHRKKEVKCLATKTNPTPERDTLKCDDECLRLQRNQRLAAALNVAPDQTDGHIPYSETTLKLFRELSSTWAQNQEREFRVFASEPSEKRLRFKPMPSFQRAFLHALAEDFGFDSESQDPEPHRHVSIFKTPRFVSAPKKTLAQCAKIRSDAAKSAASAAASSSAATASAPEPFNALLLTAPRFGLTIDEIESAFADHLKALNHLSFTTSFLPSEEILIRAVPVTSWGTTPSAVESTLASLKPVVARTVTKEGIAAAVIIVHADASLNVLRREGAPSADGSSGGWNAVVGRGAAQRRTVTSKSAADARPASGFVSFSKLARKKIVEDTVADDWEAAADSDE
ncbi:FKBP12-associated protein 1-like protein [Colletotrichum shisoi]|uniref:FKBP12-associated protein 1-like protein n=1 Tax=Colletotrichum shisoi TaxID=2078593 RepID=A0A5Q4C091_9PEZI|nr:FKBP12-associated protein 1-like protein [Colletotrichum shisoi]